MPGASFDHSKSVFVAGECAGRPAALRASCVPLPQSNGFAGFHSFAGTPNPRMVTVADPEVLKGAGERKEMYQQGLLLSWNFWKPGNVKEFSEGQRKVRERSGNYCSREKLDRGSSTL